MGRFYADAASGSLPAFTFIEPRIHPNRSASHLPSYGLPNHQHPAFSVREGERWMKNIYEAVRNGPGWNRTLLIFTYDEHGGFYDHVPPPQDGVPNPDVRPRERERPNPERRPHLFAYAIVSLALSCSRPPTARMRPQGICTKEGFEYTRLGIRVPTIAVSPWIRKGTLVHEPPAAQKPQPTSEYELSSIPATLRRLFPQLGPPLTKRDAWAATFEHVLTDELRDDCPTSMPDVSPPPAGEMDRMMAMPLDEHALGLVKVLCELTGEAAGGAVEGAGCGAGVETYEDFAPWISSKWAEWRR